MLDQRFINKMMTEGRTISRAKTGDEELGPFKLLPGVWKNLPSLPGRGWNMIALPFIAPNSKQNLDFRLLANQYNEELKFSLVDKAVPNRGIKQPPPENSDQFVATLDYEQSITQIAAEDFPVSGKAGPANLPIHHEPGLLLHMANNATNGLDIARLGTIPHGNSVLALGKSKLFDGAPTIPDENGLPIGVNNDLDNPYLAPYKHFNDNLFRGVFNPVHPNELLKEANQDVKIARTTELEFDTTFESGGIVNIPFIKRQADATHMKFKLWIQELADQDANGNPKLRLQYTQTIFLEFFKRPDGQPGLIQWPHVSINTMEKEV